MASTRVRKLRLPVDEFDRRLLPASVRGGKPAVRHNAMSDFLRQRFRLLGGRIQKIEYTPSEIQVTWLEDLQTADPINPIVSLLQRGDNSEAVILMKLLLSDQPDDTAILYNLGMACSDMGKLDDALGYLRRLMDLEPAHVNGRVALGVALLRHGDDEAASVELERAVEADPTNPWARRNLGAALMKLGRAEAGIEHLREATGLNPSDQQAWYGLGQALEQTGDDEGADAAYIRTLDLDTYGDIAELARQGRTRIGQRTLRETVPGGFRMDAMFYILGALEKFENMVPQQVQDIGFEIAMLGRRGLDINDSDPKYTLRSMPGEFSGLHLVSTMYAAFKQIAPEKDIDIDLAREYQMALSMRQPSDPTEPFPDLPS